MRHATAIIADDEKNIRLSLAILLIQLWPELEIKGQAQNGIEAHKMIEDHQPDIAFLDIKMPGMTGIEVAKRKAGTCRVVFITAFDQYAIQAFENEAIDYILKPVTMDRLKTTIERLKKNLSLKRPAIREDEKLNKIIQVIENKNIPDYLRLIKVKTGPEIRFVPVSEIIYFKAQDKYTTVQTAAKQFLINTPVKELENSLDPKQFWRVHRNSIVNIEKIRSIKRSFTNQMIIGFEQIEQTIKVSRSCEQLFKHM